MPIHDRLPDGRQNLEDLPSFDLAYEVDDVHQPTQITLFSERLDEIATNWISIDAAHALDLADVA